MAKKIIDRRESRLQIASVGKCMNRPTDLDPIMCFS
jgi:hypothetical protein